MNITKIKYDGEKVEISWKDVGVGGTETTHTQTSRQTPSPRFVAALHAFVPIVVDLLRLPEGYEIGLRVQSLSINYEEGDGREGLVVTSLKDLKDTFNAPLVLNTPHLRQVVDDEEDGRSGFLTSELSSALAVARGAAERFLDGERAQVDAFANATS